MKAISKASASLLACCIAVAAGLSVHAAQPGTAGTEGLSAQDLVYGYDEMFDFDIDAYLDRRAPHLSGYAETISHWAGYSGVSPKVLLALMEQQSGVITRRHAAADAASRPFGALGESRGFGEQTREVALVLRDALYERDAEDARGPATLSRGNPLRSLFARTGVGAAGARLSADIEFQQVYAGLFNGPRKAAPPSQRFAPRTGPDAAALAGPPNGFLQFPFPRGQSWHVGGAHTNTGSGSYPMSSLDMSQGGGWGSDQGNRWVSASAGGTFKRHSSCFAEVVHGGGWSTSYYHLMNIQYGTGASVSANTAIANPANSRAQALCNGGSSTGPHQHWSLKSNGSHHHLNGVYMSGFQITAISNSSYDTNCNRFYLVKNGYKYCVGYFHNP